MESGGGKGRVRATQGLGRGDIDDFPIFLFRQCENFLCFFFLTRLFDAGKNQRLFFGSQAEGGDDVVCNWYERLDLFLTERQDVECGGLDTAGGESVAHLFPNQSGEIVADESVEHAPGLLGFAEIAIEFAGMSHGFLYSFLGDFVEENALGFLDTAGLGDMPRNSLAFAVGVGSEEDGIALFDEGFDAGDDGLFARRNDVARDETAFDIDGIFVGFRQVADVSDRGDDLVLIIEILFDRSEERRVGKECRL